MVHKLSSVILLGVLCTVGTPTSSAAEPFVDGYLGLGLARLENTEVSGGGLSVRDDDDSGGSVTLGARAGYWLPRLPWLGFAADVSYLKPEADTDTFPISALLMLRWPLLVSERFPYGRLQPYVGAGPGLFISVLDISEPRASGGDYADTSYDVGVDVRAGATGLFAPRFGMFLEYRFTRYSPEWQDELVGVPTTLKSDISTHTLSAGVSFRF
jgi:opacity protein-like surface antigen